MAGEAVQSATRLDEEQLFAEHTRRLYAVVSATVRTAELSNLPGESYLRGVDRDQLVERFTHYLAEINAVHPFREGNGRTQRAFIGQLAGEAGYRLAWERLDPQRNVEASRASLSRDNSPLREILAELIEPL